MSFTEASFFRRLLMVIGVVAAVLLAWRLRQVALLLFGSVTVSLFLTGVSDPLARRLHLNRTVTLTATILGLVLILLLILAFFGWRLQAQISQAADLLPQAFQVFVGWVAASPLGARILTDLDQLHLSAVLPTLLQLPSYALSTLAVAADVFLVVIGGIYLAAQPDLYRGGLLRLVSGSARSRLAEVLDESGKLLRKWLLAQLLAMATVGLMVGLGAWAIGVPAPGALGLFAGLAEFVPIAGPVISAIPALLLALLYGVDKAGWTLLLFIVIQQLEGNLLMPVIQRRIVLLPPVLTLFALVSFGLVFGPAGVVMATPLTIVAVVLVNRLYLGKELALDEAKDSSD